MDLQNISHRAARSKDPPAHGRSLSSPPWSCRARAGAFRWLDRWRLLFAVLIAVFGDAVFSHFPFPSALGCHLFDKFCARAQHEFSIYFDFRARGAARNQQNPFAVVVIMVIECRSN